MNNSLQAIILAAGKSTRFPTAQTKLAAAICGQPMILFPIKLLEQLAIATTIVVGYQQDILRSIITQQYPQSIDFVTQEKQNGTGHALACTQSIWRKDHLLVLNGDVPLVTPDIITQLYEEHIKNNAAISFAVSCNGDETSKAYGKVVKTSTSIAIIEAKDFPGDSSKHCCINAGIYIIQKKFLQQYINTLTDNNAPKEFYITDLVKIASDNNYNVATISAPFDTIRGINTFQELWKVEKIKQAELIEYWTNNGVYFLSPDQTHLDLDVRIGACSTIHSNVRLLGSTIIGQQCVIEESSSLKNVILDNNSTIRSHSAIKDSYIQSNTYVGPFAHIHSRSTIGNHSIIGNFVEVKNSTIGDHSKAKHLAYIGDATIGSHVNIGAGTITCNYDGVNKHKTIIEDNAFIGSNNTLIAPVTIGKNAFTAAGSTITEDVPENALAIARAHQITKADYTEKLQQRLTCAHAAHPENNGFSFVAARLIHPDSSIDEQ
jgi:bifunctional UDP-N-acetylglucosamine pyrophosphorylase / glucosamine-1-phosphate N-acetyltransferase